MCLLLLIDAHISHQNNHLKVDKTVLVSVAAFAPQVPTDLST